MESVGVGGYGSTKGKKKAQLTVAAQPFPLLFLPNKSKTMLPKRRRGVKWRTTKETHTTNWPQLSPL